MGTTTIREWADAALDFVYPPICPGCSKARDSSDMLCEQCTRTIQFLEHPICLNCTAPIETGTKCTNCSGGLPLFALGYHFGPLQRMVIGLKFHQVRGIAQWAAGELATRQKNRIAETSATTLVPIPLHPTREYFRGYNQAELLAEHLADPLDLDIRYDLLTRTRHRREQSRLSAHEREKNIHGVFGALPVEKPDSGLLLVDDVVTSGATVGEAIRVLQGAGHRVVGVLAIAHRA